jgi:hypothetical protein
MRRFMRFNFFTAILILPLGLLFLIPPRAEAFFFSDICRRALNGLGSYEKARKTGLPVPELAVLKLGDRLPETIFQKYEARTIATALILQASHDGREKIFTSGAKLLLGYRIPIFDPERAAIWVNFREDLIDSVIAARKFSNMHELKLHRWAGGIPRQDRESTLLGYKFPSSQYSVVREKISQLLPIYGYVETPSAPKVTTNATDGYGVITAVLKPAVKRRATWTPHDSLFYNSPALTFDQPYTRGLKRAQGRRPRDYLEAQIWGGVEITDIEKLLVPEKNPQPSVLESLKRFEVPIYSYTVEIVKDRWGGREKSRKISSCLYLCGQGK